MKKSFKSVLTFALALVMMVTCMAVTAFASSSDSTTIAGYSASANVSYTRSSATATTTFGGPSSAYVSATVTAYYESGDTDYRRQASGLNSPGYSVARINIDIPGAQVRGAEGEHRVYYDGHQWTPATEGGVILHGAEWD